MSEGETHSAVCMSSVCVSERKHSTEGEHMKREPREEEREEQCRESQRTLDRGCRGETH